MQDNQGYAVLAIKLILDSITFSLPFCQGIYTNCSLNDTNCSWSSIFVLIHGSYAFIRHCFVEEKHYYIVSSDNVIMFLYSRNKSWQVDKQRNQSIRKPPN